MDPAKKEQFGRDHAPAIADDGGVPVDSSYGAKGLQRDLQDRLKPDVDQPASRDSPDRDIPARPSSRTARRVLKIAGGVAIVAVFGWMPLKAIWQTSSVEASGCERARRSKPVGRS